MKAKIIAVLIAVLLLIGTIVYDAIVTPRPMIINQADVEAANFKPTPAPDFSFTTLDEKTFALKDLQQETILVHFWAGWCTVCFAEFPELLEFVEKSDGKVGLLSIAIDDEFEPAQRFMDRLKAQEGVKLDIENVYWVWDESKDISLKTFNTIRVPETIVIDKNRQMVDKIVGPAPWLQALQSETL